MFQPSLTSPRVSYWIDESGGARLQILISGFLTATFDLFMQNKFIFHPYTLQDSTGIIAGGVVLSESLGHRRLPLSLHRHAHYPPRIEHLLDWVNNK